MKAAREIKGWCPSAWRPMLTGDGYLVRLNFSCGIVSSQRARAIACLSERFGNGLIDLTRRANLQIRGVVEKRIPELQTALLAEGIIAENADGGARPGVIASPLAGRDRAALIDIRPIVRELEERLAHDPRARNLPAKFCLSVDDGGRFPLLEVAADIAFEACSGSQFAVRIGGVAGGVIAIDDVAETALALVAGFISLRTRSAATARRMRDLVEALGADAITASCATLAGGYAEANAQQHTAGADRAGQDAVGRIADDVLGIAAPFGCLHYTQLALMADVAEHSGDGELRLTPWRAILIPATASGALELVEAECARAGLITDAADPRRHIAACPGAPACASATVATRDVAAELAPLLRSHETLHVSGCAKGCASSASASVVLIGRDGDFDLVRNGKPSDAPVLSGLSAEEACRAIERITAERRAHV